MTLENRPIARSRTTAAARLAKHQERRVESQSNGSTPVLEQGYLADDVELITANGSIRFCPGRRIHRETVVGQRSTSPSAAAGSHAAKKICVYSWMGLIGWLRIWAARTARASVIRC
jgi:hypothetical protein